MEAPVNTWTEQLPEAARDMDLWVPVTAAGLQQQDFDIRVFRKTVCERTTGRAGADDDLVPHRFSPPAVWDTFRTPVRFKSAAEKTRRSLLGEGAQAFHTVLGRNCLHRNSVFETQALAEWHSLGGKHRAHGVGRDRNRLLGDLSGELQCGRTSLTRPFRSASAASSYRTSLQADAFRSSRYR